MKPYKDQTASAQNAYADLFDAALAFHVSASITGLNGSFGKKKVHGHDYWYFQFRDIGGAVKQIYLGPESDKLSALILARRQPANEEAVPLQRLAAAAVALGCEPLLPKHYRVIRRLAEYGFFKCGGILVGTHAFMAMCNMLGNVLIQYYLDHRPDELSATWMDACSRGPGWRKRLDAGLAKLAKLNPAAAQALHSLNQQPNNAY